MSVTGTVFPVAALTALLPTVPIGAVLPLTMPVTAGMGAAFAAPAAAVALRAGIEPHP